MAEDASDEQYMDWVDAQPPRYKNNSKKGGAPHPANDERVQKSSKFIPLAASYAQNGIPGPWYGQALTGCPYETLREQQNPGSTRNLRIYDGTSPVCLLHEHIRPAKDGQCASFEQLMAQRERLTNQKINAPEALAPPEYSPLPISKVFATGKIAFLAAHQADAIGQLPAHTAAGITSMPEVVEKLSVASDAAAPVDSESPPYFYWLTLPIPKCVYNNNPRHLLDFRATKEAKQYGILVSFVLQAMSNIDSAARIDDPHIEKNDM